MSTVVLELITMAKLTLSESIASPIVKKGNRWLAILAVPGKGRSGTYSRKVLAEQGPSALPPGTKAFIGHALPQDRNPRDQFGKYPEGARYDDDIDPVKYPEGALVAELEVFSSYKDMIDDIADEAELSMFIIEGTKDANDNVIEMAPHRANTVDLVAFGGLEGSGLKEKLSESYHISVDKPSDETSTLDTEKEKMDKETTDAITAAVKSAIASLAEAPKVKTEAEIEAEVKAKVEAEVGAKVDEALAGYDEKLVAISAAGELLPSQVESLKVEARKGKDITLLIESAKAVVAEAKTTLIESLDVNGSPRINETATKAGDFLVGRWTK